MNNSRSFSGYELAAREHLKEMLDRTYGRKANLI